MALSARDWDIVIQAPLFKAMGPTITRAMIGDRAPKAYGRGEQLFEQGEPADGFFCILEGWAKLYRLREDGEEVVVAIFSAGETFAEVAMFLGGRYPASCEAVSAARILKIDAADLRRAVLAEPQLAFDICWPPPRCGCANSSTKSSGASSTKSGGVSRPGLLDEEVRDALGRRFRLELAPALRRNRIAA